MTLSHRFDGSGDHVVVLSGSLGSTLAMWEPQLDALKPRRRVLRYDHPGHGDSPLAEEASIAAFARQVVSLLDEVGLDRVDFCGLSLGGAVGMELALRHSDRIRRLVLACTSSRFATPEFWTERAQLVRDGGVDAVADVVLERWFTPDFADVGRYRAMLVSTPAEGYLRCCEALRDWDVRGTLSAVGADTLAIAGRDDPSTPPSDLEAIAGEIPRCSLTVLDGARHLANVECSEGFDAALVAHFVA